jgi:hypothetical protein
MTVPCGACELQKIKKRYVWSELLPQIHPTFKVEFCHDHAVLKTTLQQIYADIKAVDISLV